MLGITATTIVHAAGEGVDTLWQAVSLGRTALRPNSLSWCDIKCWTGAAPGVEATTLPEVLRDADCRNHRLAWLALRVPEFKAAIDDALGRYGPGRVGLVLGSSTSGIRETEIAYASRLQSGGWPAQFDWRTTHAFGALTDFTARASGTRGPSLVVATACSSSAKVFLTAQRWIDAGWIDAAIVGGVDSLCLSTLHGFDSLQLLSDEPCRPFDAARKGISLGEAGGFALLERRASAVSFAGGGESSDAHHISTPHPDGLGARDAMLTALASAKLRSGDIGYVNAHGTATLSNDRSEAAALVSVFGARGVPVSSTKGTTGHALGAAGILEALVTIEALRAQLLPPTTNVTEPDASLQLDLVTVPRNASFRHAMSNSFGFGGSNCALVFSRTD